MARRTRPAASAPQVQDTADSQTSSQTGSQTIGGQYPAPCPSPSPDELSAVLVELLRKINSQVPPTPPLEGRALAAVENFQEISAELATLADVSASNFSTSSRRSA